MKRIRDYAPVSKLLTKTLTEKVVVHPASDDMRTVLAENPKLLVALNHGPLLGPAAAIIALNKLYMDNGGANRKPLAIMWRLFYQVPVWKYVVEYLTQVDHGLGFDECVRKMQTEDFTDLLVMPEGENCNYGNGLDIEPFLSPRFIELALQMGTPILLVVHEGSEHWARSVKLPKSVIGLFKNLPQKTYSRIRQTRRLSIPTRTQKLSQLRIFCKLYTPKTNLSRLPKDKQKRREKLTEESNKVHDLMQSMIEQLQP